MIDKTLQNLENEETDRLNNDIELIASENYPSQDILDLMGSHFSVKYSEGFPKEVSKQGRHYAGCHIIDKLENYAISKACELFKCKYANVQPWSGSQANQAVYAGLLKPGDTVLAMSLESGGHLTHVSSASNTGKIYSPCYYGLDENGYVNYDEIKNKLNECHPKLLVVGASAYPREINFKKIREIVDEYNKDKPLQEKHEEVDVESRSVLVWFETIDPCLIMVDMAHIAGLVATGEHMSPLPYADVVTSTTHKTLRGPRGGLILWNDEKLCSKLNSGVFPKMQGGANQATIAAKAQCFIEALTPEFHDYTIRVKENIQALIKGIKSNNPDNKIGFVSDGSDNHLLLLDIKKTGIYGKEAEDRLTSYGIITNKNMITGDTKPSTCTGIRLGTAAITTRGFTEKMCFELGQIIAHILLQNTQDVPDGVISFEEQNIRSKLKKMIEKVGPFYKKDFPTIPNEPDDLA